MRGEARTKLRHGFSPRMSRRGGCRPAYFCAADCSLHPVREPRKTALSLWRRVKNGQNSLFPMARSFLVSTRFGHETAYFALCNQGGDPREASPVAMALTKGLTRLALPTVQ